MLRHRRVMALLMLFALVYSSVESITGVLRDGEIHHESMAVAAAHAQTLTQPGRHVHDADANESHDDSHSQPGSGDHCSHHHGAPLITTPLSFAAPSAVRSLETCEVASFLDWPSDLTSPPPQV